jgi:hypothetical protein
MEGRGGKETHDAGRIVPGDYDVLEPKFVQVERVPAELWICTIETFTATHKLDEQRHCTLDDRLRLGEQCLVFGSGGGTLREEGTSRGALTLGAGEEVCAGCWERATVYRERGTAVNVEAWVGEWPKWWKSRRRRWGRRDRGISRSREDDRADGGEGKMRQFEHELRELSNQGVLRLGREVVKDRVKTDAGDLEPN